MTGGSRWHIDDTSGKIKLRWLLLKEKVDVDVGVTVAGEKMSWWRMLGHYWS
jgi:hypothetical protein